MIFFALYLTVKQNNLRLCQISEVKLMRDFPEPFSLSTTCTIHERQLPPEVWEVGFAQWRCRHVCVVRKNEARFQANRRKLNLYLTWNYLVLWAE